MMNLDVKSFRITTISTTPIDRQICSLSANGQLAVIRVDGGGFDSANPDTNNYSVGGGTPMTPGGIALVQRTSGTVSAVQESITLTVNGASVTIAVNISGDNVRLRFTGPNALTYHHLITVTTSKYS